MYKSSCYKHNHAHHNSNIDYFLSKFQKYFKNMGNQESNFTFEAMQGDRNFVSVDLVVQCRNSVSKIIGARSDLSLVGTGFLFGRSDCLKGFMTCNHVLPSYDDGTLSQFRLTFESQANLRNICIEPKIGGRHYINNNCDKDITFIEISEQTATNLETNGAIFLPIGVPQIKKQVVILQHPEGGSAQLDYGRIMKFMDDVTHNVCT